MRWRLSLIAGLATVLMWASITRCNQIEWSVVIDDRGIFKSEKPIPGTSAS